MPTTPDASARPPERPPPALGQTVLQTQNALVVNILLNGLPLPVQGAQLLASSSPGGNRRSAAARWPDQRSPSAPSVDAGRQTEADETEVGSLPSSPASRSSMASPGRLV